MNPNKNNILLAVLLSTGVSGIYAPLSLADAESDTHQSPNWQLLAQSTTTTQPPQAPSFLKQAGQKLLENAQKKVLQNVNQKLQGQSQTPPPATAGTAVPGAAVPANTTPDTAATTVAVPATAPRQAAPCRSWVNPQERPIACILCIHGLGLQSNSYEFFGKETSRRGIAVYAIDVRGFGSWMQAKGKTKVNFDESLADIKQALESIRAANPGLPVYILGESMGGAIALRAASMYPDLIDGLISSVPAGERFNQGKTSMKVFLNLLAGFDVSNVGNDVVNAATKSAKLQSQWKEDPLARLNLTPQELIQFQDFMNNNHEAAKKVSDMPVLFVQGNGDQLVKPEGTWELFNSVAAKDKSFFAVPGEHLIFEEAQTQEPGPRDQNFRIIQSWLSTKVGRRNRGGRGFPGGGGGNGGPRGGVGGARSFDGGQGSFGSNMGTNFGSNMGSNTAASALDYPARLIQQGQFTNAITELEQARAQRPNDPDVLEMLGRAYYGSGQLDKAGFYLRRAMRMQRTGGEHAREYNAMLLDMSQQAQNNNAQAGGGSLPFAGFAGKIASLTNAAAAALPAAGKCKVYAFYANWADQCKGLGDALTRMSTLYGDKVDITRVNVEDAGADALVEQFKVGPIPTVVFVTPSGQVGSTVIGESSYTNYEAALKAITQQIRR